jgi:uncharacterized protein YbdZ (MbtH family)
LSAAGYGTSAGSSASGATASSSKYQQIINNKTGAFSVIPAGASIPSGYSATGSTKQSYTKAVNAQAASANVCTSAVPGYCAVSNFFSGLMQSTTWFDIGFVVIGGILLAGAFMRVSGGKVPAVIPV